MASWQSGMGVDPVALCSHGVYSEVYGAGEEANIANLFASLGFIEDAIVPAVLGVIADTAIESLTANRVLESLTAARKIESLTIDRTIERI